MIGFRGLKYYIFKVLIIITIITCFLCQNLAWAVNYTSLAKQSFFKKEIENLHKYSDRYKTEFDFSPEDTAVIYKGLENIEKALFIDRKRVAKRNIMNIAKDENERFKDQIEFIGTLTSRKEAGYKFYYIDVEIGKGQDKRKRRIIFYDKGKGPPIKYIKLISNKLTLEDKNYMQERGFWLTGGNISNVLHKKIAKGTKILKGYNHILSPKGRKLLAKFERFLGETGNEKAALSLVTLVPDKNDLDLDLFVDVFPGVSEEEIRRIFELQYKESIIIKLHNGCYNQCSICLLGSKCEYSYMPFPVAVKIMRLAKECGCEGVQFHYDNDPFHYRDRVIGANLTDVIREMKKIGLKIEITTNGWMRGDRAANYAAEEVPSMLERPDDYFRVSYHLFYEDLIRAVKEEKQEEIVAICEKYKERYKNVFRRLTKKSKVSILVGLRIIELPSKEIDFPEVLLRINELQKQTFAEIKQELEGENITGAHTLYMKEELYKRWAEMVKKVFKEYDDITTIELVSILKEKFENLTKVLVRNGFFEKHPGYKGKIWWNINAARCSHNDFLDDLKKIRVTESGDIRELDNMEQFLVSELYKETFIDAKYNVIEEAGSLSFSQGRAKEIIESFGFNPHDLPAEMRYSLSGNKGTYFAVLNPLGRVDVEMESAFRIGNFFKNAQDERFMFFVLILNMILNNAELKENTMYGTVTLPIPPAYKNVFERFTKRSRLINIRINVGFYNYFHTLLREINPELISIIKRLTSPDIGDEVLEEVYIQLQEISFPAPNIHFFIKRLSALHELDLNLLSRRETLTGIFPDFCEELSPSKADETLEGPYTKEVDVLSVLSNEDADPRDKHSKLEEWGELRKKYLPQIKQGEGISLEDINIPRRLLKNANSEVEESILDAVKIVKNRIYPGLTQKQAQSVVNGIYYWKASHVYLAAFKSFLRGSWFWILVYSAILISDYFFPIVPVRKIAGVLSLLIVFYYWWGGESLEATAYGCNYPRWKAVIMGYSHEKFIYDTEINKSDKNKMKNNFVKVLIHEIVHNISAKFKAKYRDYILATAFGELVYYENFISGENNDPSFDTKEFNQGIKLIKDTDMYEKIKMEFNPFTLRDTFVVDSEYSRKEDYTNGTVLAGMAWQISQETGNIEDAYLYLRLIFAGYDFLEAELVVRNEALYQLKRTETIERVAEPDESDTLASV